ncbi:MAG: glycosyltransferase [bacterium]|nr:glycosyltransferase [bacterium]
MKAPKRRKPTVSVIVRTKDRPVLLREALTSLENQGVADLQVIVVNDGGVDVSDVVANGPQGYEIVCDNLSPARGRVTAANRGLELADGDWIAFLDDDDIYLENGLAELLKTAQSSSAVVYGRVTAYIYDDADLASKRRKFHEFGRSFDLDVLLGENFIPLIGCLIPASALRTVGGLDESLEVFEDWDLFLKLSDHVEFVHVPIEVAEYRTFGESFITGGGGEELQLRGRAAVYSKHWERLSPDVLSRMQQIVKTDLIPREVAWETREWQRRVEDLEGAGENLEEGVNFLRAQVEEKDKGIDYLRRELDDRERCIASVEAERQAILRDLECEPTRTALISIVVVNYNGRHHLERCLPSVFASEHVNLEVIVVDNGSSDDSVSWTQEHHPEVRLLEMGENLGFGAANQRGVEVAGGAYIAFLNSDTVVEPKWLLELLRTLMVDTNIAAACSTLRLLEHPDVLNGFGGGMSKLGYGFDHYFGCPYAILTGVEPVRDVLFPTAAAMLMRKNDFRACGAFDPKMFMYHEDVDLGWRLHLHGRRVVVCRDSVVHHHFGGTSHHTKGLQWRERLGSRHNVRSILKHYEIVNVLRATKGLFILWWRMGAYRHIAHVLAWNVRHLPSTLRQRRAMQGQRLVRDAELIARGLISPSPYPAPTPEVPRVGLEPESSDWIFTPVLRVGHHSALGRLGYGWFPPHPIGPDMARPFSGQARCWLKVEPGARGRIEVDLHVPPERAASGSFRICANDTVASTKLSGELWQMLAVDNVVANEHGLVEVVIEAPSWRPHLETGNWDFRRIGGAVKTVRFVSETQTAPTQYEGVSVVITTFNRWSILEMTLDALAEQDWSKLQIVVVDDGSSDDTWERLREYRDTNSDRFNLAIATQENQGQGLARNHALSLVEEDLVLFLGDDIIPEPDLVRAHVERHREVGEPTAVVGFTDWYRPRMRITPFMEMINLEGHQFGYGFMASGKDQPFTCFYTSNISLDRSILGGSPFDSTFNSYGWEDVELGYRLSKRGVRIVYEENARAGHFHPTDIRSFYKRQVQVGRTHHDLLAIHPELAQDPHMPPLVPPSIYRLAGPFARPTIAVCNALDRRGIRVPKRVLNHLMMVGFYEGRSEG